MRRIASATTKSKKSTLIFASLPRWNIAFSSSSEALNLSARRADLACCKQDSTYLHTVPSEVINIHILWMYRRKQHQNCIFCIGFGRQHLLPARRSPWEGLKRGIQSRNSNVTSTVIVLLLESCRVKHHIKIFFGIWSTCISKMRKCRCNYCQTFIADFKVPTQGSLSASKALPLKAFSMITKPSSICGNLSKSCRDRIFELRCSLLIWLTSTKSCETECHMYRNAQGSLPFQRRALFQSQQAFLLSAN